MKEFDLIQRRYNDINKILKLPFKEGYELIKFALEEENEQRMYLRWVVGYQSLISFTEFKNKIRQMSIQDNRDAEDILADVERMMSKANFSGDN